MSRRIRKHGFLEAAFVRLKCLFLHARTHSFLSSSELRSKEKPDVNTKREVPLSRTWPYLALATA